MQVHEDEIEDTRIFGYTHREFEALPEEKKQRLLLRLDMAPLLKTLEEEEQEDEQSYDYCFEGIPQHSTVAVSTVGVMKNADWNGADDDLFRKGYNEMMKRLEPTTVLFYGAMVEGLEGNIIRCPSYYEEKRNRVWRPKEDK